MSVEDVDVLVVGAGATGLAAAHELRALGREVLVVDAGDRPGGVMRTEVRSGFLFECGPNTVQVKAPALRLLQRAGLEPVLVRASPESRKRFLLQENRLEPVPLGPASLVASPLLSTKAKLRLLAEPFVRRGDAAGETVAEFVSRRLGSEPLEKLVGPFLVGVYAGDERRLGAEAVFPTLVALERESGSLVLGALRRALRRGREHGLPGTYSAREGLGVLARRLAQDLGDAVCLRSPVRGLGRDGGGWRVELDATELRARAVLLAADAAGAAPLLKPVDPESAGFLADVEYAPLVSAALPVNPALAARPLEGFGFLVPRQAGIDLLGALFMSRLFPRRAPADRVLVTAMIGGVRWPAVVDADDAEITARICIGLERGLGLREMPEPLALTRWRRAVPQPGPEHAARVTELRRRLEGLPGLELAGSYLDGVGVADAFASGMAAARRLVARD